jgi:predicted dehydrogenase
MKTTLCFILLFVAALSFGQQAKTGPLRIGIAGLSHSHVHGLLGSADRSEIQIVGIAESDRALAERYLKRYNLSPDLLYPTLDEMLAKAKPEAVTAFNSIYDHLEVVKKCAPLNIHVMVEKPLAVSLEHARQMETLAKKYNIYLLTNYETTWYGSNHLAYRMIYEEKSIGALRKVVVHDGHRGPKEIGVNQEFLHWLTDPVQNGGGAIMDFGCYGANLITWLLNGEKPESVTAITQQIKPEIYPKVDDEATILITYPKMQGVIQASWNWPYNRKDMEMYGQTGYIKADRNTLSLRIGDDQEQQKQFPPPQFDNPFVYLAAVVHKEVIIKDTDLSSLPLNMTAMEILEAARQSAKEGKTIHLKRKK